MGFKCLVRGQEVDGSNPFAPTIISPLNSILYAAFSTVTSGPDLGTTGTTEWFLVENVKRPCRVSMPEIKGKGFLRDYGISIAWTRAVQCRPRFGVRTCISSMLY